jgi:hypothetical protein
MTLAIVTFTDGSRPADLERCVASIAADTPPEATHHIIQTTGYANYASQRVQALSLADYVCFVDDDDIVVNGAITKCLQAITATNAGVSFTDEALVDVNGKVLTTREGVRTYEACITKPWMIHHLVMLSSKCVTGDFTGLNGRVTGVDNFLAVTALNHSGAVHVPIIGYNWTQHPASLSHHISYVPLPPITVTRTGEIPTYTQFTA